MRLLILLIVPALLWGCATLDDPAVREAREHISAGRSEQALVLLERAMREKPDRTDYRTEYFRARDLVLAQWTAQAEMLRSSGQPEAAAEVYRRMQKYDAGNVRAQAGLDQLEADALHRQILAMTERLMKDDRY